jgi:hypothetical protein
MVKRVDDQPSRSRPAFRSEARRIQKEGASLELCQTEREQKHGQSSAIAPLGVAESFREEEDGRE